MSGPSISPSARYVVLFTAIGGLLFDGVELGLMPVASLSVSQSLLGDAFKPTLGGDWFARFTAALMLGAALNGGILMLSQIARTWHITPGSWRWIFQLATAPAALGLLALTVIPESPLWLMRGCCSRFSPQTHRTHEGQTA
jgi:MFS family permease